MQWHPIFVNLLRPLVESHFEVRTDQTVGDLPRSSDVVLLHKTSAGPPPFQGLWRRLTTWNVLEYKGPTESPRFDQLHDMVELGLGIHRRLNERQRKDELPEVAYAEVSFWYIVKHLGQRFLAEAPSYLPGLQQEAEGVWRSSVFAHPVLLVSVQELTVERDSMALHVLAGVPEGQHQPILDALKAEPALRPSYGAWLSSRMPSVWKEFLLMVPEQEALDLAPFAEYLKETHQVQRMVAAVGVQQTFEALEALGLDKALADLSPEQRERLSRAVQQARAAEGEPNP